VSFAIILGYGKLRSEASQVSDIMDPLGRDRETLCTRGSCFQYFSIIILFATQITCSSVHRVDQACWTHYVVEVRPSKIGSSCGKHEIEYTKFETKCILYIHTYVLTVYFLYVCIYIYISFYPCTCLNMMCYKNILTQKGNSYKNCSSQYRLGCRSFKIFLQHYIIP